MFGHFRHTLAITKWAVTNQLSGRRLWTFFYWTRFIWQQCAIQQYHSDLSDQSALEIRVRLKSCTVFAFFRGE